MTEREQAIEAAARVLFDHHDRIYPSHHAWSELAESVRDAYRADVRALLASGLVLLPDQLEHAGYQDVYPSGKFALSMTINKVVEAQPELFRRRGGS